MLYPPLITVYTLPACVQCVSTKRKLDQLQKAGELGMYRMVDLSDPANEAARKDILEVRGIKQAPYVIVTQDQGHGVVELDAWRGFDPDKLIEWAR